MRTETEIRNKINSIKTDLENPEKAHIKKEAEDIMRPFVKGLEWVLDED